MQLQFVTYIFVNAMGKMKELFIKDIEDNARHITYDVVDEWEHFDDDYHYQKHLQGKAMKTFQQAIKTLCLTTAVLLSSVSYGQDDLCYCQSDSGEYFFFVQYTPWGCSSDMEETNCEREWYDSENPSGCTSFRWEKPMPPTHWAVWKEKDDSKDGVYEVDFKYGDLSEYDNKPYVKLDAVGRGGYHFEIYNSETNKIIGNGRLILK